jgi:cytoskeleton protein RodZ
MAVEAGGIGARLRAGREKLGLTILQASERLHTDSRILDALEADDFATLGAPVYARGHIRHYAELVGESAAELNALYANLNQVAQPDLTRIAKVPQSDNSSKLVAPALLVIAVFAIAGAVWWVSALSKKEPRLSETHVVGSSDSQSESATLQGATPGAQGSGTTGATTDGTGSDTGAAGTTAASGSASSATAGQSRSAAAGAASGPAMRSVNTGAGAHGTSSSVGSPNAAARTANAAAGTGSAQTKTPAAAGSAGAGQARTPTVAGSAGAGQARTPTAAGGVASGQTRAASAAVAAASPPAPATGTVVSNASSPRSKHDSTVTLRYSADSWTEVYDASGTRLFYDVGAANTVQNFSGTYPLRVVLGNASGVSVEFNGHNAPIANLLHPDGSAQFSINRSGRVVRARPVADGG